MNLVDKFGRQINYLRLSVTDRCNLRCSYCMPERGMTFAHKQELLSYEELLRLMDILGGLGVRKTRLTGGEPFVRSDLMYFVKELKKREFLDQISITSNLTLISPYIDELLSLGVKDVNVSLDALDKAKFHEITRRDKFDDVYYALDQMIANGFNVKINCVVMKDQNVDQIIPMMELARQHPISVRFLEEMPFNGSQSKADEYINHSQILEVISKEYECIRQMDPPSSTSQNYFVDGFKGSFGIIPSFSRTFCGDCNRLRLSATGEVRTCLYGKNQLNARDLLRSAHSDLDIKEAILSAVLNKPKDGFAAADENEQNYLSMTKLGG